MSEARVRLDVIDVKRPCPASWDAMAGDERSRFCEQCGLHVHNLSAMTLDEAQQLVCDRAGRLCVRYERDAQGRVVTLDYQRRERTGHTWRFWTFVGGTGALAAAVIRFVLGSPAPPLRPTAVLGDVMVGSVALPASNPFTAPNAVP